MKIIVKDSDTNLNLKIPSGMILNTITATILPKALNKKSGGEFKLTGKQLRPLVREINRFRKKHKDWVLVEVEEDSTGERVIIKL